MSFGYVPDYQGRSLVRDVYLRVFGFPYAPRRDEARIIFGLLGHNVGDRILDLGCGDGVWTNDLAKNGFSVTGIDICSRDVLFASERARNLRVSSEYVVGDAQTLPFGDETFDRCIAICSLEHMRDDDKVFCEVYRVLEKDGVFVFSVPTERPLGFIRLVTRLPRVVKRIFANDMAIEARDEYEFLGLVDREFSHFRRYSESSVASRIGRLGFVVNEIRYNMKLFGGISFGAILSLRLFGVDRIHASENKKPRDVFWHGVFFPFLYVLHRMDDLVRTKGHIMIVVATKV